MTNPLVLNNIPLTGTYNSKRNSQFQTILPLDIRKAYVERQGKEKINECWIYMSKQEDKLILKDVLEEPECPDFNRVKLGLDGRFIARFNDEDSLKTPKDRDLIFRGFYDYVEASRAR